MKKCKFYLGFEHRRAGRKCEQLEQELVDLADYFYQRGLRPVITDDVNDDTVLIAPLGEVKVPEYAYQDRDFWLTLSYVLLQHIVKTSKAVDKHTSAIYDEVFTATDFEEASGNLVDCYRRESMIELSRDLKWQREKEQIDNEINSMIHKLDFGDDDDVDVDDFDDDFDVDDFDDDPPF